MIFLITYFSPRKKKYIDALRERKENANLGAKKPEEKPKAEKELCFKRAEE